MTRVTCLAPSLSLSPRKPRLHRDRGLAEPPSAGAGALALTTSTAWAAGDAIDLTLALAAATFFTATTLFFRVAVVQGAAATLDVILHIEPYDSTAEAAQGALRSAQERHRRSAQDQPRPPLEGGSSDAITFMAERNPAMADIAALLAQRKEIDADTAALDMAGTLVDRRRARGAGQDRAGTRRRRAAAQADEPRMEGRSSARSRRAAKRGSSTVSPTRCRAGPRNTHIDTPLGQAHFLAESPT